MRKKAITKIKIQDILDKAEVSRGTFHNHFEDKYDLIRYCYDVKVLPQWDYKQEEDMDAAEHRWKVDMLRSIRKYARFMKGACLMGEANCLREYIVDKGRKADLVYLDIKNRDHGQTLDEAFLYWDYLFSGIRREEDGSITQTETILPRTGDTFAFAVADGFDKAWLSNRVISMKEKAIMWNKLKYHGLQGAEKIRGSYLCVPLSFLAEATGAGYESEEDGAVVILKLKDGRRLQFARGSIGCVIDNIVRSMYCEALWRGKELLISVEWFAKYICNFQLSSCNGMVYVTDHFTDLSANMVDLIKDLFKGEAVPENFEELM